MINWDLAHDRCPTESGWKPEAQRFGDQVLCFCKQFCWLNSLANKNKTEQWEPQFLRNPTSEYSTATSTTPAGQCQATCMAAQGSRDHRPPVLRDLSAKGAFLQARTSAGLHQTSASPGQLCPSFDAEALERWAGGLLMGQCRLGLRTAS